MSDTREGLKRLTTWGWNERWAQKALSHGGTIDSAGDGDDRHDPERLVPGRVVRHVHHTYDLITPMSPEAVPMEVSGAYSYRVIGPADYPTAGDWVLFRPHGRIEMLLPRDTVISRGVAGEETLEQVIVANVDVIFLVFGLDGGRNFTTGMLERSVLAAWNSGGRPVIVLNKSDCADTDHVDAIRRDAEDHAPGVPVHVVSAHRGDGLAQLSGEIGSGETVGMLGKSGVGKSALVNGMIRLTASETRPLARTGEQRKGDRQGRHTTSEKVLYMIPGGIILADVPGLRELQLWGDGDDLSAAFPDVEALAAECRFNDCEHAGEPGCRVQEAIAMGELTIDRYERYLEYRRELAYLERRRDQRANAEEQKKWKRIAMEQRRIKKR